MSEAAIKFVQVTPDELRALIREELAALGAANAPHADLDFLSTAEAAEIAGCTRTTTSRSERLLALLTT